MSIPIIAALVVAAFFAGMFVGGVATLAVLNRGLFREHEAEIRRRRAELDAKIAGGCRR